MSEKQKSKFKTTAGYGAYICLLVASIMIFIPIPGLNVLLWILAAPLLFVAFIIAIVAIAQGDIRYGISTIMLSMIIPLFAFGWQITWMGAISTTMNSVEKLKQIEVIEIEQPVITDVKPGQKLAQDEDTTITQQEMFQQAHPYLISGNEYFKTEQYQKAIIEYKQALTIYPDYYAAEFQLSKAQLNTH